jgi:hypothetical protein
MRFPTPREHSLQWACCCKALSCVLWLTLLRLIASVHCAKFVRRLRKKELHLTRFPPGNPRAKGPARTT